MDISGYHGEISVFIHQETLVPSLVEMACSFMSPIEITGIGDIKPPHEFTKVPEGRFEQHMKVVGHENVAVRSDGIDRGRLGKHVQKLETISIIPEDCSLVIPPAGNMIDGTGKLYS